MTETFGTAAASFSAGHVVRGHIRCGRQHGHRWRLAVTIKADPVPETGEIHGLPELATAVEQLAAELDRENLNDMLPGSPPTPAGLALAARERLSMVWHNIIEIRVDMDDVGVTVRS